MFIDGPAGKLEALVHTQADSDTVAILCHPHPLYQGTMHNKVVTTMAKACDALGYSHIRFNYRGVGDSEGEYGAMQGEIADAMAVREYASAEFPGQRQVLMGFSFGSFVAANVAKQTLSQALVTIGPAVNHADFQSLTGITCPWFAVIAGDDELIPLDEALAFAEQPPSPLSYTVLDGASHFFHGRLLELRELLVGFLHE